MTHNIAPDAMHIAAVRTLEHAGYTYHGSTHWKPPLGPSSFPLLELLDKAMTHNIALEAELKALREQKPVAWDAGILTRYHPDPYYNKEKHYPNIKPLYADPVPPVLRDLSDAEISACWHSKLWKSESPHHEFARAIIKAAREKTE